MERVAGRPGAAQRPVLMVLSSTARHGASEAITAAPGFATRLSSGRVPGDWGRTTRPPARLGRPLSYWGGARGDGGAPGASAWAASEQGRRDSVHPRFRTGHSALSQEDGTHTGGPGVAPPLE